MIMTDSSGKLFEGKIWLQSLSGVEACVLRIDEAGAGREVRFFGRLFRNLGEVR